MNIRFTQLLFAFLLFPFFAEAQVTGVKTKDVETGHFKVAPYLQYATKNSIVVMWETFDPSTSEVWYGPARYGDKAPNLSMKEVDSSLKTMHEVVIEGLNEETKYLWKVRTVSEGGKAIESQHSTFATAIKDSTAFGFILYGDSQSNPEVWGKVATLGWLNRPNFGVLAGDLVDRGGMDDDWLVEFFPPAHVFMNRYPLYTVIGNHEDDHPNYYKYVHNPDPEYYYTFTYGNAQFFMIDTNRDVSEGSEQYDWLEWELAKSDAQWKFVVHHHPPYSSEENDHGDSWVGLSSQGTDARDLVPLLEQYQVDFDLFGHVHMYERTWPIFQGTVNQKKGVVYINSGGAGGGLEDFDPVRSWFSKKVKSTHHLCYFMIHEDRVSFQAIDDNGHLFDTFEMNKQQGSDKAQVNIPPPPRMDRDNLLFVDQKEIKMRAAFEGLEIRYTLDGSEPTSTSFLYTNPLKITKTTQIKARCFTADGHASRMVERTVTKAVFRDAEKLNNPKKGLQYRVYTAERGDMENFDDAIIAAQWDEMQASRTPSDQGIISTVGLNGTTHPDEYFGMIIQGYINVPKEGIYTFYTNSDDGSKLYIGDEEVVDNGGYHGGTIKRGQIALKAGFHSLRINYFQGGGGKDLQAGWVNADGIEQPLPVFNLFHK